MPQTVTLRGVTAVQARLSLGADARGDVLVVLPTNLGYWFSLLDLDDGWSVPRAVDAGAALAVAPGGDAISVFEALDGGVRANRFRSGGWAGTEPVAAAAGDPATSPAVTLDDAGRSVAVWQSNNAQEIWASRHEAGGAWSAPIRVATPRGFTPRVVADNAANALAVWTELDANLSIRGIRAARYANGTWDAPQRIQDDPSGQPVPTGLVADGAGNVLVVWYEVRNDRVEVWARRFVAP